MSAAEEILIDSYGYEIDVDGELELREALEEGRVGTGATLSRFIVDDDDKASWALLKIRKARGEMAEVTDRAARERAPLEAALARINEWERRALSRHERDVNFFESLLIEYLRRLQMSDAGLKSRALPAGSIASRTAKKWSWDDEAFLLWCKTSANEEFVRVIAEPDKAAAKKAMEARRNDDGTYRVVIAGTAELVSGVTVEESTSYKVETPEVPDAK